MYSLKYPPYRLETSRLVIRVWDPADASPMADTVGRNLDHLRPWMPWALGDPPALDERIELMRRFRADFDTGKDFIYGVFNPDESAVWGGTGLHDAGTSRAFQIGYWLDHAVCGQGLATELSLALVGAAFLIDTVDRVEIRCDPLNQKSRRIPEKLGFELEGVRRRHYHGFPGEPRDSLVFTLFRDQLGPEHRLAGLRMFDAGGRKIEP